MVSEGEGWGQGYVCFVERDKIESLDKQTIRFNHESAIFSWVLHLFEVRRGEIRNDQPWQKTNLMNIAPGRGSAWWNRKWRAMQKTNLMNIAPGRGSA